MHLHKISFFAFAQLSRIKNGIQTFLLSAVLMNLNRNDYTFCFCTKLRSTLLTESQAYHKADAIILMESTIKFPLVTFRILIRNSLAFQVISLNAVRTAYHLKRGKHSFQNFLQTNVAAKCWKPIQLS